MPRFVVTEFLTLDGVMQAPGAPNEDHDGDFDHGGWQMSYFDDMFGEYVMAGIRTAGGLLLGRRTYDIFNAHWPHQPADDPIAPLLNAMPKHVVSSTLSEPLSWENSHLISGDVPAQLARLREAGGRRQPAGARRPRLSPRDRRAGYAGRLRAGAPPRPRRV